MALTLDTRQRAMLQEMGITLWLPQPASVAQPAQRAPAAPAAEAVVVAPAAQAVSAVVAVQPPVVSAAAAPAAVPKAVSPVAVQPPAAPEVAVAAQPLAWRLAPSVQVFPQAAGPADQSAWLIVWECPNAAEPLEGETGQLLRNMLRALRLHHNPHVWVAALQHPERQALQAAGLPADAVAWQPLEQGLPQAVQHIQPARMLLLGLQAARAVLACDEALGRLRAQMHMVQGVPAIVSYDPAYLLRAPHAKPSAWADLCRAHALKPPLQ